jgi:L-fuculose-phosphate aldolase
MNENDIKTQICDICGKMWQLGWVAANDGNVTVKLGGGLFFTTPAGISKAFITPDKIVKINAKGELLEGDFKPSSEIKMHLRCYEEREDIGAVIHAHPPAATGFAVANKPLDGYNMIEAVLMLGSVPVTPYATPSTQEVPDSIAPYLQEHDALLLQNHGALTIGADLITAFHRMETLELWAKISLNAHLLGGSVEISRENIDKLCSMRENYGITGKHPGYKKFPEMNYIDEILPRIHSMNADEIIEAIGGNFYDKGVEWEDILKYPQFVQDIIFLVDLDTALAMNGDVLMNNLTRVPNMITALKNVGANNDSTLLQKIYDEYTAGYDEDRTEEVWNHELYKEMYFYNDLDIWGLLEKYVELEKAKKCCL